MISSVLDERRLPSFHGDLAIAHCRYSTTGSTVWENAQPTLRLGPAPGRRDRAQRQPREHARAPRRASRRARPAPRQHGHGAPDRPPRRRAGRGHGRGAGQPPAAGPRRLLARDPRPRPDPRRPRPVRLPAAVHRADPGRRRAGPRPRRPVGRRRARRTGRATPGSSRPRRPAWTSSAPSSSATSSRARSSSSRPGANRARSGSPPATPALCVFELIYFARPDSYLEGRSLYEARRRMGIELAREHPVETDLVMPVPDTGAPGGRRLRRGVRHPVPRGPRPEPLHRAGPSSSRARRSATAA